MIPQNLKVCVGLLGLCLFLSGSVQALNIVRQTTSSGLAVGVIFSADTPAFEAEAGYHPELKLKLQNLSEEFKGDTLAPHGLFIGYVIPGEELPTSEFDPVRPPDYLTGWLLKPGTDEFRRAYNAHYAYMRKLKKAIRLYEVPKPSTPPSILIAYICTLPGALPPAKLPLIQNAPEETGGIAGAQDTPFLPVKPLDEAELHYKENDVYFEPVGFILGHNERIYAAGSVVFGHAFTRVDSLLLSLKYNQGSKGSDWAWTSWGAGVSWRFYPLRKFPAHGLWFGPNIEVMMSDYTHGRTTERIVFGNYLLQIGWKFIVEKGERMEWSISPFVQFGFSNKPKLDRVGLPYTQSEFGDYSDPVGDCTASAGIFIGCAF